MSLEVSDTYMSPQQIEYFRQKLLAWKEQLPQISNTHLHEGPPIETDLVDCAANEIDKTIELSVRDRERKLISKIEDALRRIGEGSYGYCDETGEPIGIKRLEAFPIATLSVEAQERREKLKS